MMKYLILNIFLLVLACNSTKNTTEKIASNYTVKTITAFKAKLNVEPTIRLDFKTNTISGQAGCNHYSGTMVKDKNTINFTEIIATKMYCSNMKIEKAFFKNLSLVKSFKIEGNKLLLFDKASKLVLTGITN